MKRLFENIMNSRKDHQEKFGLTVKAEAGTTKAVVETRRRELEAKIVGVVDHFFRGLNITRC
jgi:hypothetical protein